MIWHVYTLKAGRLERRDGQRFTLSEEAAGWSLTPDDPTLPTHAGPGLFEICDILNAGQFKKI